MDDISMIFGIVQPRVQWSWCVLSLLCMCLIEVFQQTYDLIIHFDVEVKANIITWPPFFTQNTIFSGYWFGNRGGRLRRHSMSSIDMDRSSTCISPPSVRYPFYRSTAKLSLHFFLLAQIFPYLTTVSVLRPESYKHINTKTELWWPDILRHMWV